MEELRTRLIGNEFENMGDGETKDGTIKFKDDHTFTLWDEQGTWKLLDSSTLVITFKNEEETYKFNQNGTEAVCTSDPLEVPPMKIKMCIKEPNENT